MGFIVLILFIFVFWNGTDAKQSISRYSNRVFSPLILVSRLFCREFFWGRNAFDISGVWRYRLVFPGEHFAARSVGVFLARLLRLPEIGRRFVSRSEVETNCASPTRLAVCGVHFCGFFFCHLGSGAMEHQFRMKNPSENY